LANNSSMRGTESAGLTRLPTGTVTFLISDIQASTAAWDRHPEGMKEALARHDAIFETAVVNQNGAIVESGREGDSLLCVFTTAAEAVRCALDVQLGLNRERWPAGAELAVRVALHTGEPDLRDAHYHGQVVYRAARLMATAHGGQIVVSSTTRDLVVDNLPPGASLRDLGLHLLKDLSRAEQVFQLVDPQLPSEFPPLRSPERPRTNLPVPMTSYLGRETEFSELAGMLRDNRLVTITGTGGLGKTRTALEVAGTLLEEYPDGVWLAELGQLSDSALVPQAVATSLGVREVAGQSLSDTLTAHLAPRRLLLVLDNCEHLVEPCATLAESLLGKCAQLRMLATSQVRLGVAGEVVYRLVALAEAAQLFVDRARLSEPRFSETAANGQVIAQLCQRLDGIPLAIELAAARVKVMSVDELLSRLDDRFRVLSDSSRTALPRHQTMRATVDWGYELLSQEERSLFRRLSVFAGGFTLDAVEAVCAGDGVEAADVMDLLARLVDKSLVVPDEGADGASRMRLLDTLRQYGRGRLAEDDDGSRFARRHALYFLELAEEARHDQRGARYSSWLAKLEDEHDNLRAALETALAEPDDTALALAAALLWFWDVRGYLTEGHDRLSKALSSAPERTAARARAADAAGWLSQRLGDFAGAGRHFEESVSIAREIDERLVLARALRNLSLIRLFSGLVEEAENLVGESLSVAKQIDDEASLAGSLLVMALVAYFANDLAAARTHAQESADLHRKLGDEKVVAFLLACLASLAIDRGDHAGASAHLAESLAISRAKGDRVDVAFVLETSASLAAATDEPERALLLAGATAALRESVAALPVPHWRMKLESSLAKAREALGPAASEEAFAAGTRLNVGEAIDLAAPAEPRSAGSPARPRPPGSPEPDGLTKRELEIAVLVARGMTNKDIAKRLFIAPRTVDAHVEHIRNKLGYHSRAQVAAWATEHGLLGASTPKNR
jgi:predicted ATPase/class 3 adenylate cyclase/DNA-binding CsgD family transcriptional regulator